MLRKAQYPHLNRKQRRHPKAMMTQLDKGWGMSWLLAGLMVKAGITKTVDGAQV